MMKQGNKVTINDVARAAGVSKGTVDRVLHNRGEVSAASRQQVLDVIKELGYRPNIYASLLASRKEHRIVCIIPEFSAGEFWELTDKGIARGREFASGYGIPVHTVQYDQYDMESFQNACARTLEEDPVGVVLAPMFRNETLKFVKELSSRGIYYVYIDSKLEEDGYLAYFGMPMYQSGYLCADILTMGTPVPSVNIIRVARDKKGLSDPTLTRRTGFVDYINEHFPDCDAAILSAAVADFTPEYVAGEKIKREDDDLILQLHPTQDIAAALGALKSNGQVLVGFALETNDEEAHAREKLQRKNFDFIVLNSLKDPGAGFRYDTNKVTILTEDETYPYPLKEKSEVAIDIIDFLESKMH